MTPVPDVSGLMLSVLVFDPGSQSLGIALASSSVAIGSRCPHLAAGKAAVASQGFTNLKVGPLALDLVECGLTAKEVMGALRQHDRWMEYRQIGIVSAVGGIEAHTGEKTKAWAGHITGEGVVCLANGLSNRGPLDAMHECLSHERGNSLPLAERMLLALERGRDAVGRWRAMVSSSLLIRGPDSVAPIDLRVDLVRDSTDAGSCAVHDLRHLYEKYLPLAELYVQRSTTPHPV